MSDDDLLEKTAQQAEHAIRERSAWAKTQAWSQAVTLAVMLRDAVRNAIDNERLCGQARRKGER